MDKQDLLYELKILKPFLLKILLWLKLIFFAKVQDLIFPGALWQKRPKCESISSTTSRTKLEQQQIAENASFPFRLSKGSNAIVRAGSVSSCQEERGRDPMRFWKKTSLQTISTRICEQPKWNNRNLRRHQVMLSCYTELKKNATKQGRSYFPCPEKCSVHEIG